MFDSSSLLFLSFCEKNLEAEFDKLDTRARRYLPFEPDEIESLESMQAFSEKKLELLNVGDQARLDEVKLEFAKIESFSNRAVASLKKRPI